MRGPPGVREACGKVTRSLQGKRPSVGLLGPDYIKVSVLMHSSSSELSLRDIYSTRLATHPCFYL